MQTQLTITCLCGAVAQTVTVRSPTSGQEPVPLTLCHCTTCRHTSGVLCTSYCPIAALDEESAKLEDTLTAYASSPNVTRYFCRTCGCHVFRRRRPSSSAQDHLTQVLWEVATGVITDELRPEPAHGSILEYARHDHVADTGDGGLAVWLLTVAGRPIGGLGPGLAGKLGAAGATTSTAAASDRAVSAACHCGNVQFSVLPPDHDLEASRRPHSGFSDLLVPFASTDKALVANPDDVKWWLRPPAATTTFVAGDDSTKPSSSSSSPPTRYLAGTCACQSCRLATGFEIQTWAFVPRVNILFAGKALDFRPGSSYHSLATYQSSPGVERNFCSCCGATVFWHDVWRPDLIDVSVGLLRGGRENDCELSRVESLLDWCTTRVSFAEEAPRGRRGLAAQRAVALVGSLGTGM